MAGLATVGIGLWLIFQEVHGVNEGAIIISPGTPDKFSLANGDLKLISILLLSIGALVTFVSLIGCTGACVKSRCLLMSVKLKIFPEVNVVRSLVNIMKQKMTLMAWFIFVFTEIFVFFVMVMICLWLVFSLFIIVTFSFFRLFINFFEGKIFIFILSFHCVCFWDVGNFSWNLHHLLIYSIYSLLFSS